MGELKLITGGYEDDAHALLCEADEMGFETIVIIGIRGDDALIRRSRTMSRSKLLGLIELAKHEILCEDD